MRLQETSDGVVLKDKNSGQRTLNLQLTDKIAVNDIKTKITKNVQLARKRNFPSILVSMMSTLKNRE